MYNTSIHAQQTLYGTVVTFSLSETADDGFVQHLASASHVSTLLNDSEESSLWIHLEQVLEGVVKTLSQGSDRVWSDDQKS